MAITIENDGKEKYQSFTALSAVGECEGEFLYAVNLEGWGSSEAEARKNLHIAYIKMLEELKKDFPEDSPVLIDKE